MKIQGKNKTKRMLPIGLWTLSTLVLSAQEQTMVSIEADVVSSYIWRGQDCGGVSIQPTVSLARSGFSVTVWGSAGLEKEDTKEFDLTFSYNTGGFNISITDYWFDEFENSNKYFNYKAHSTKHIFEATAGYDFGLLALNWNTNFAGSDYTKSNGKRAYSSYFEASALFKLRDFDCSAEIGLTPWEGAYSDKFNVTNIGITITKEIKISNSFDIPIFAKVVVNPNTEKAYFIFGITF